MPDLRALIPNKYLQYAHTVYVAAVAIAFALTSTNVNIGATLDVLTAIGGLLGLTTAASISSPGDTKPSA